MLPADDVGVGKNLLLIFGVETFSAFASTVAALPDFADSSLAALASTMDIPLPGFPNAVSEHMNKITKVRTFF